VKRRVALLLLFSCSSLACPDDKPNPGTDSGVEDTGTANPQLRISPDPSTLTYVEGQPPVEFTVTLSEDPKRSIAAQITSSDPTALAVDPADGALDSSNWNTGFKVTVTTPEDEDADNESVDIKVESEVGSMTDTVTVVDNDASNLVVTPPALTITEGDAATINVHLSAPPADDVTIAVASQETARLTLDLATLTFTPDNWDTDQAVTVLSLDDADIAENLVDVTFDHPANADVTLTVTIQDDDAQSFVVDPATLTIAEAGSGTFTVALAGQPAADVTVTLAPAPLGVALVDPTTLTFTTANWDQPQTVTASGVDDPNITDDLTTITLSSPDVPGQATVEVTVTDDDTQIIEVTTTTVTVNENGTASFGVRLAFMPAADVDVSLVISDPNAITTNTATLTFTSQDFDLFQFIDVTAADDLDAVNGAASIVLSAFGAGDVTVSVTIADDDQIQIETDLGSLTVGEGMSDMIGVRLSAQPTADVIVSAASVLGAFTATPPSLTFTTANWDQYQFLSIDGVQDQNVVDENDTLELTAPGVAMASVPINVIDDDFQAIVVSNNAITVDENGTATFDVTLAYQPATDVTVDLAPADAFIGAAPASLVFTPANWNVAQTVTVSAADDQNTTDETSSVLLTSAQLADVTVTVMVNDDDMQAIVLSANTLTVAEGASGMFTARLAFQPAATRTVTIQSSDVLGASVAPTTLSFDATNWNTPQPVTVSGTNDADTANENVTITLSSTGLANATVAVTVTDDDVQAIELSANTLALTEGAMGTINVNLAFQPAANVTVTVTSGDGTAVGAAPAMLTFTPANFDTPQPVTISALQDNDLANETVTVTFASAGVPNATLTVTTTDNDTQALQVTPLALSVGEGASGNITVRLAFQPAANVTVNIASQDNNLATAVPTTLTFTPANYATVQNVAINGVQDADVADETVNVVVSSTGLTNVTVAVTVVDDDVQNISVNPTTLAINEGAAGTFGVSLTQQPAGTVTVNIGAAPAGQVTLSATTLTFDATNYNTVQNVTVTAPQDDDALDEDITLTLTSAGLTARTVSVSVNDDDTQAIVLSANTLAINEGANGTITVRLAFNPVTNATVNIVSGDAGAVTRAPATLTFTAANYQTPQTVTLTGVQDADTRNETVNVQFTSAVAPTQTLQVSVTDDDVQALILTTNTVALNEGASQNVGVRLAFDPVTPVTVTAASSDAGAASATPTTLTFTSANYQTSQNLTIMGVQDADTVDENATVTVQTAVAPSMMIAVSVNDDDTQAIVVNDNTLDVGEGGSVTFTARLAFDPISPVTVMVASSNNGVATALPTTLNFNTDNYNVAQTVTVMAAQDDDTQDGSVTVTLSSAVAANQVVTVAINDDDTQTIVVSANTLTIAEDQTSGFTVRLGFNPLANVTVTIANPDQGALTVAPTMLMFTAANYDQPQTVNVTGINDADTRDENVTLTLSGAGAPTPTTVAVTVTDDEVQALVVEPTSLNLTEQGAAGTFTVSLAFEPDGTTTVNIGSSDTGVATVGPLQLTFTPGNYTTPQTVTVTPVADQDVANETITVAVSTAVAPTVNVTVNVVDDDTQAIVVSTNTLTVPEARTRTFNVRLAFQPAGNVVVTMLSADPTIASLTPAMMTFTPLNYATPRNVTVTATPDQDLLNESTTITVSSAGLADQVVNVDVTDDDAQSIILSRNTITMDEETQETFTVRLAFIPIAATEVVTVTSSDPGAATALPSPLTFDANTYATPQTVTVNALTDEDILDENVTVTLDSNAAATPNVTVAVDIDDIDVQAIVLNQTTFNLTEGGANGTVMVSLAQDPSGNQTVTITSPDPNAVSRAPATVTFNTGNYTTPVPVTLGPVDDADVRDESVDVTFTSPAVTTVVATVNVNDDDTQSIQASTEGLTVVEGGTNSFTVRLEFEPTNPVTVSVNITDPIATANPTSVIFNAGNYDTPVNVTISGTQDADLDDESSSIVLSTGGAPPEGAANFNIGLDVTDDDTQAIVAESIPATLGTSLQEGGPTVTFTVQLAFPPRLSEGGTDTVDISSTNASLSFSPTSITFDTTDWDQPVDVIVTAADDANAVTENSDADLVIANEVSGTHSIRVVDDEITVIGSTTYQGLSGGTQFTKRQNIQWGSTRLGLVGFDTNGDTRIGSNTRELDDAVTGPAVLSGGGGTNSTEAIEFDGTNFRWFLTNTAGINLVGSDETASSTFLNQNFQGTAALNFWPAYNGGSFGVVFTENGASDRLRMRIVQLNGAATAATTLTVADGTDDVRPNAHYIGPGYTVVYSSAAEVRCLRTDATGTLVPNSDTALTGFPAGGTFVSTVYDGTDIVAAYFNGTNSLNVVRINPATCAVNGAHQQVLGSFVYLSSPPTIAWNGSTEFAVAYDFLANNVEQVGVILVTPALANRADVVVGPGTLPSITWAGDRWALRYGDPITVEVGSFQD
jgi:hypothetical protein